jgi:hypothetical protein
MLPAYQNSRAIRRMRVSLSFGEIEHWAAVCTALGGALGGLWAAAKTTAKADNAAEGHEARVGTSADQRKTKSANRAKLFYLVVVVASVGLVGWAMWGMSRDIWITVLAAMTVLCCELLAFLVMYRIFRWLYRPTTPQPAVLPSGLWARFQASKLVIRAKWLVALGGLSAAIYAFVRAVRLALE